jgi:hypothetical protein
MLITNENGTFIRSKLVGTSKTKIQFNLFDISLLPDKMDRSSFEIDLNTLQCTVKHWNMKLEIGQLQFKYLENVIAHRVKLINFKITGLDKDGNIKYRNVGINIELQLLN